MKSHNFVKIRQKLIWHYVGMFLDTFNHTEAVKDEMFKSLLQPLISYVEEKLFIPCDGDISDIYVVIGISDFE